MGTDRSVVKQDDDEKDDVQEERNEKLMQSIALYVAHCGGDVARATEAQTERMADALATWILTSGGE